MILMYYTILQKLWLTARFTGGFYISLSQAKLNIISIIAMLQRFTPSLHSMLKVI